MLVGQSGVGKSTLVNSIVGFNPPRRGRVIFKGEDVTYEASFETVRKGNWKADGSTQKKLLEEYVDSVNRHGVGCAEHTCGNARLQKYVMEEGRKAGIPVPALEGFQKAMEKATGDAIDAAADKALVRLATHTRQP